MWSAEFSDLPPQVSRKFMVITISGRCWRMTAQIGAASTPYQNPIRQPKELNLLDADDLGRFQLLGLTYTPALLRLEPIDAGFTTGDHCTSPFAGIRPPRHGSGGTELKIIRMGNDAQRGVRFHPMVRSPAWCSD